VHTFLTQSKYIQIPCTYVLGVTLPMCLLFYHYIWQSCSEVVATLFIHSINQIVNGWGATISVVYVIQYARLKYKCIEYQSSKYWCKFDSYLYSNKITSIKSDPFKNITKLYRLWIFPIYFYILWLTIHVYV